MNSRSFVLASLVVFLLVWGLNLFIATPWLLGQGAVPVVIVLNAALGLISLFYIAIWVHCIRGGLKQQRGCRREAIS